MLVKLLYVHSWILEYLPLFVISKTPPWCCVVSCLLATLIHGISILQSIMEISYFVWYFHMNMHMFAITFLIDMTHSHINGVPSVCEVPAKFISGQFVFWDSTPCFYLKITFLLVSHSLILILSPLTRLCSFLVSTATTMTISY